MKVGVSRAADMSAVVERLKNFSERGYAVVNHVQYYPKDVQGNHDVSRPRLQQVMQTPYVAQINGEAFRLNGYCDTLLVANGKGERQSDTGELYVYDDLKSGFSPVVSNPCWRNVEDVQKQGHDLVDNIYERGQKVAYFDACRDVEKFGSDASYVPHIMAHDEFMTARAGVSSRFNLSAPTTDDYVRYLENQQQIMLKGGTFVGKNNKPQAVAALIDEYSGMAGCEPMEPKEPVFE